MRPELNKAACLICGVESECLQALSVPLCPFRPCSVRVGNLLYRALMSRVMGDTHTHTRALSDQRKRKRKEGGREGRKRERECIYGDILPLMSAPPLGSISLTFMLDRSISLSPPPRCSLSLIFSLAPSLLYGTFLLFLPIIQSAASSCSP